MNTIRIPIGQGVAIAGHYANRHGLIAGATGTGKTVTLQTLAEGFSRAGAPVLIVDVKGDVSGLAMPGPGAAAPVRFLDVYGRDGAPLNVTVERLGPDLFARLLGLTDIQSAVVEIAFSFAESRGMPLRYLGDVRAVLGAILAERESVSATFGQVSPASVGVIQRGILRLEQNGGAQLFAGQCFDVAELIRNAEDGRGVVSILAAERLMKSPAAYSGLLLWLLCELYNRGPEVGDLDRPRLVVMIDEAHLLFDGLPPALLNRIEQVIRLIRSKGFGVYFCSQSPDDLPATILGQLGNRVQHGLRAATARDLRAIRAAAETLPSNPGLNAAEEIARLSVGYALVSVIGPAGTPTPAELIKISLPACRLGAITEAERQELTGISKQAAPASALPPRIEWPAVCVALILAAGLAAGAFYGAVRLWESGWFAWIVAGAVTLWLGLRKRLRTRAG